jgi:hypothetical protein
VAGFACAKLIPLKARLVKAITKTLIVFFTISPPFLLDVILQKCFNLTAAVTRHQRMAPKQHCEPPLFGSRSLLPPSLKLGRIVNLAHPLYHFMQDVDGKRAVKINKSSET